jgi:predicted NBD/HSP70 family sugar kinase
MHTGTNLIYTKQYNLRIVLEVIRLFGPLSRAGIARRTELTVQTVSNLVKDLLAFELVYETGQRREGRGAPSTAIVINPEGAFTIGLDLDRDHLTAVLVDLAGTVRQRLHVEVDFPTPVQALDLMVETADALIAAQGLTRKDVSGAGVGVPGLMHRAADGNGYVVSPMSFPNWHDVPLADWLQERLEIPILLENNATAAAIGERWYGAGRQIRTFFYLYVGSGLGGGLIIDGQPYSGFTGNAGEIGYLPTVLVGDPSGTDETPHIGMHFRLPMLYETLRSEGIGVHTPEDLDRLLCEGHPRVLAWMDEAADHLTGLVLAVEYLLDPEAIFFGGRLPDRVVLGLMNRVADHLPRRRISQKVGGPRHLLAAAGADAAALGVATLPIYESFAPAPHVLLKRGKVSANAVLSGSRGNNSR